MIVKRTPNSVSKRAQGLPQASKRRLRGSCWMLYSVSEPPPSTSTFSPSSPLLQTVLRSLFSFYASHVQCFLAKHAAFHMYYKLALEKTAYQWQVPECVRETADAAVHKYQSHGYELKTASRRDG
ncbi:hypothetical protein EV126DRAFT_179272 [Verticillium dahliae]|nr:hypothetical protein EV126DRAFT_179272 [Verticillium dahliae]